MQERVSPRENPRIAWLVAAVLAIAVVVLAFLLVRDRGSTSITAGGSSSTTATAASTTGGSGATDSQTGLRWVELAALPSQAQATVALIRRGGPYPYRKDGATFGNREGVLPSKSRGYYREYTVQTPGSSDRGARRVVTGDGDREFFYTDDHYRTFRRVRL